MHWGELVRDRSLERVHEGTNEVRSYGDWFIKFPALAWYLDDLPPDLQPVVEHLAYRVYALFQIKVPASCLIHDGQQLGIATRKVRGSSLGSFLRSRGWDLEQVRQVPQAGDVYAGFYVDVHL